MLSLMMATATAASFYDLSAVDNAGNKLNLAQYAGNVTMVITEASIWGFTPTNFDWMNTLPATFAGYPFQIIIAPSNTFKQEPRTNADVATFIAEKLNSTSIQRMYSVLSKSSVNEDCTKTDGCRPDSIDDCCMGNNGVFDFLRQEVKGKFEWNYAKQLIYPDGTVYNERFGAGDTDPVVQTVISQMLGKTVVKKAVV